MSRAQLFVCEKNWDTVQYRPEGDGDRHVDIPIRACVHKLASLGLLNAFVTGTHPDFAINALLGAFHRGDLGVSLASVLQAADPTFAPPPKFDLSQAAQRLAALRDQESKFRLVVQAVARSELVNRAADLTDALSLAFTLRSTGVGVEEVATKLSVLHPSILARPIASIMSGSGHAPPAPSNAGGAAPGQGGPGAGGQAATNQQPPPYEADMLDLGAQSDEEEQQRTTPTSTGAAGTQVPSAAPQPSAQPLPPKTAPAAAAPPPPPAVPPPPPASAPKPDQGAKAAPAVGQKGGNQNLKQVQPQQRQGGVGVARGGRASRSRSRSRTRRRRSRTRSRSRGSYRRSRSWSRSRSPFYRRLRSRTRSPVRRRSRSPRSRSKSRDRIRRDNGKPPPPAKVASPPSKAAAGNGKPPSTKGKAVDSTNENLAKRMNRFQPATGAATSPQAADQLEEGEIVVTAKPPGPPVKPATTTAVTTAAPPEAAPAPPKPPVGNSAPQPAPAPNPLPPVPTITQAQAAAKPPTSEAPAPAPTTTQAAAKRPAPEADPPKAVVPTAKKPKTRAPSTVLTPGVSNTALLYQGTFSGHMIFDGFDSPNLSAVEMEARARAFVKAQAPELSILKVEVQPSGTYNNGKPKKAAVYLWIDPKFESTAQALHKRHYSSGVNRLRIAIRQDPLPVDPPAPPPPSVPVNPGPTQLVLHGSILTEVDLGDVFLALCKANVTVQGMAFVPICTAPPVRSVLLWTTAPCASSLLSSGHLSLGDPRLPKLSVSRTVTPLPDYDTYCAANKLLRVNFQDATVALGKARMPDMANVTCLFVRNVIKGYTPVDVIRSITQYLDANYRVIALLQTKEATPLQPLKGHVPGFKDLQHLIPSWLWVTKKEADAILKNAHRSEHPFRFEAEESIARQGIKCPELTLDLVKKWSIGFWPCHASLTDTFGPPPPKPGTG